MKQDTRVFLPQLVSYEQQLPHSIICLGYAESIKTLEHLWDFVRIKKSTTTAGKINKNNSYVQQVSLICVLLFILLSGWELLKRAKLLPSYFQGSGVRSPSEKSWLRDQHSIQYIYVGRHGSSHGWGYACGIHRNCLHCYLLFRKEAWLSTIQV